MAKLWCIMSRFYRLNNVHSLMKGVKLWWMPLMAELSLDIRPHKTLVVIQSYCTCVRVLVPACVSACTRAMLTTAVLCVHSSNVGKQGHVAGRWTVWVLVAPGEGEGNLKPPSPPVVLWNPWTQRHAVSATLTTALIKGLIIRFQLRSNLSSHIIALC